MTEKREKRYDELVIRMASLDAIKAYNETILKMLPYSLSEEAMQKSKDIVEKMTSEIYSILNELNKVINEE